MARGHGARGTTSMLATRGSRTQVVVARTLGDVIAALQQAADDAGKPWLDSFRTRYLDLELSRCLYEMWRAGRPPLR